MQRYFFDITDGKRSYPDPLGIELPGPIAARQHALDDARALLESWMVRSALPWRIEVHDASGAVICVVRLAEAAVSEAKPLFCDDEELAEVAFIASSDLSRPYV
ncbi:MULTISPECIES: DUF6894 family protein [Microvirga]|uniref:DUF6894 family protein n=1 Tax=Microvirga TaxID=186650 RepID=UPI001CFCB97A|nr:hypothetical protein [Microvirga lenta]MCB5173978.1 hypothetical protein [Microvirga lenta]